MPSKHYHLHSFFFTWFENLPLGDFRVELSVGLCGAVRSVSVDPLKGGSVLSNGVS